MRKRNLFTDNRSGSRVIAFLDETDIARHINMSRAAVSAGNKTLFTGLADQLVGQCLVLTNGTGRADFHTGSAEPAVGILKRITVNHHPFTAIDFFELNGTNSAKFLTDAHTASAENAAVHFMQNDRIGFISFDVDSVRAQLPPGVSHILGKGLQLAFSELRTAGTFRRMGLEHKVAGELADSFRCFSFCVDDHAILHFRDTGSHDAIYTLLLHHAHSTGPGWMQIFMGTKVGNIDPVGKSCFQNRLTLFDCDLHPIDHQIYICHS